MSEGIFIPDCWEVWSVVPVFKNVVMFLPPPIKTDTPNGKPQKHPLPLKSKAHFQEMILEKKTPINQKL